MTELESSKCYQISVTAVNAKGNSTPVVIDFSCDRVKETLVRKWEAMEYLCCIKKFASLSQVVCDIS